MNQSILKRINKFDNYILFNIEKYMQNEYLDRLMPIVTSMGNGGLIWITIAGVLMLDKSYKAIGNVVILTLIISTIIGEGIVKHLVRRVRPCNYQSTINLLIAKPMSYSFPSGHTVSSFAVAEILSIYFSQYKLIFIGVALLIAFSRLYLYVHYPSDIISGIIIGILCSKLVFIILRQDYLSKYAVIFHNKL